MLRKVFFTVAFAGLMSCALPVHPRAFPASAQPQAQQQNEQSKAVAGKVTAIGVDKKSLSMEVHERDTIKPMQFVIDNNTQVEGRVNVGTNAIVKYEPTNDGKNLALIVIPQDTE